MDFLSIIDFFQSGEINIDMFSNILTKPNKYLIADGTTYEQLCLENSWTSYDYSHKNIWGLYITCNSNDRLFTLYNNYNENKEYGITNGLCTITSLCESDTGISVYIARNKDNLITSILMLNKYFTNEWAKQRMKELDDIEFIKRNLRW